MSLEGKAAWDDVAGAARGWWRNLQPDPGGHQGDRGALARLRRATSLAEVLAEEASFDLWRRLPTDRRQPKRLPRMAVVAHVLAYVREDRSQGENGRPLRAIEAVGRCSAEDAHSAILKPLRFRRLLAAREDDELMRDMRRLVALADGRINVGDLGASLFFWNDATRTRWAFNYYAAGAAAPRFDDQPAA